MGIKLSEHFTYFKLLKFTFPTIVMMIFSSLYSIVDGIFISNFAGADPFAGVNIVWPVLLIFGTLGFMVGTGGSALVSKTLGEGKKQKAKEYFSMLIYFEIIVGILLSILGFYIIRPLAKLLGAEGDILEYGVVYAKVSFIPMTAYILQNSFQSFMVAAERPKLGLFISILAGVANMLFDFIFVYVFNLGCVGAAIATGISQCVGGLVPLGYFMCENGTHYRLVKTKFEMKIIAKACSNGLSEMVMNTSLSLVNMLYNYQLLKIIGPDGVIAYGIITYVSYIFVSIFLGYSIGSAPIVSFNYGAKNTDEIQNLFKRGMIIIFVGSFVLFGISEAITPILAKIFVGYDEQLYELSVHAIRLYFLLFLISGYNTFASSLFTGLNNGLVSAIIAISRTLIFEAGCILVLPLMFGLNGIWMAVSCAEVLSLFVTVTLLLKYRKRYHYF